MALFGKTDNRVQSLEAQVCELETECAELRRALDRYVMRYESHQYRCDRDMDYYDAQEDAHDRSVQNGWLEQDGWVRVRRTAAG